MKEEIKLLLEELYVLDQGLKKYEKELIKIINEFITSRPDTKFTDEFKQQLRVEILSRIDEVKKNKNKLKIYEFTIMNKLFYAIGGALACVALLIVFYPGVKEVGLSSLNLTNIMQVQDLSAEAFGSLAPIEEGELTAEQPVAEILGGVAGRGGGGYAGVSTTKDASFGMIAPDYVRYIYKYVGENIELPDNQVKVLKRIKNANDGKSLWTLVKNIKFNGLDFNFFQNVGVQMLSFVEDRDNGYQVTMNFDEGSLSVGENWQRWQSGMNNCRDDVCFAEYRLDMGDMLEDDEILSIANQFLAQYNFDLSEYGDPIIDNDWRIYYAQAESPSQAYVPEVISVLYPQILDGKQIYEENGAGTGVRVNVNIRFKKVNGIYGLFTQNYQGSDYEAETDISKILKIAEQGGRSYYNYDGAKVEELSLGTPQIGYMKFWKYENNMSEELLIPALIFPLLDNPKGFSYQYMQNVVVPLVKDVLNQQGYNGGMTRMPEPVPLPMIRDDGSAVIEPDMEDTTVDLETVNK